MNIQITGDCIEVTPKIKEMVDKKLSQPLDKLLKTFNEEMKIASMRIEKNKYDQYKVNLDMNLPGKYGHIYSENSHEELVTAITGLREQVEKQIKKYKQNLVNYSLG